MLNDIYDQLLLIKKLLLDPCDKVALTRFEAIEKQIGLEVPAVVKNLIMHCEEVNFVHGMFSGYEVHRLDELERIYSEKEKALSFFGEYSIDSSMNLIGEKIEIFNEDPERKNTAEATIETNLARFLPVAQHKGDYLVVDLLSEPDRAIYELMMGHSAFLYSPSVMDHLDYLSSGIGSGDVYIEDEQLDFPVFWCHRRPLKEQ